MTIGFFGPEQLEYPNGNSAALDDVLVVLRNTTTAAALFKNDIGQALANPVFTDEFGNLSFFVEGGLYDLLVNGARIPIYVSESASGSAASYVHQQTSPAGTWIIPHGLGKHPDVVITLEGSIEQVYSDVSFPDLNTVSIEFNAPVAGFAYL